jgi:hypothetical protein
VVPHVLDNPFLFVGTVEEIAEQVLANRERFGFTRAGEAADDGPPAPRAGPALCRRGFRLLLSGE